jgi:hypothetical protein
MNSEKGVFTILLYKHFLKNFLPFIFANKFRQEFEAVITEHLLAIMGLTSGEGNMDVSILCG